MTPPTQLRIGILPVLLNVKLQRLFPPDSIYYRGGGVMTPPYSDL